MTIIRTQTLAILLLLFVTACAKSNTRLGSERDGGDELIHDGSAHVDDDSSSASEPSFGPSVGTAASPGSVQTPDTGSMGNSGQEAIPIDILTDAGGGVSSPTEGIPTPPVIDLLEDPEVRQARLDLISEYCSLLEKFPCLDSKYDEYNFDAIEERVRYCEQDLQLAHYGFVSTVSGSLCKSEWEAVLECTVEYDYSCPCPEGECILAHPDNFPNTPYPCEDRVDDRFVCDTSAFADQYRQFEVAGERFSCTGHLNPTSETACLVVCPNDEADGYHEYARLECNGPFEGPFECVCMLNFTLLRDAYEFFEPGTTPDELVPDCETATKMMADGRCHDITDCCFTWVDDEGTDGCGCTADVTQSSTGAETCEELAAALGGVVVDLCPRYKTVPWEPAPR